MEKLCVGRENSSTFFMMKSGSFDNNVHFFTLSHKGSLYVLQPNVTLIQICFQQSLTQDCHLSFWNLYIYKNLWCIFICQCLIVIYYCLVVILRMYVNHITNGCLHKKYLKQRNFFASSNWNSLHTTLGVSRTKLNTTPAVLGNSALFLTVIVKYIKSLLIHPLNSSHT